MRSATSVGLLALAVLAAILFTYPLAFRIGRVARVNSDDGKFSIWNVAWVARTLVVSPASVYDANIFYPHRGTLAYSESNLGTGALAIPVYWLTRNAVAAHNSAVLIGFVLSAAGMFLLARHLTGDRTAAAVAAILYAYCPHVFSKFAHVQLMMTFGLPFALLAFHRLVDAPHPPRVVALAAALVAQALTCAYYGIFAGMSVGYASIFVMIRRGLWRDRRYLVAAASAAVLAVAIVLPLFLPYRQVQQLGGFGRSLDEAAVYSADWRSYLTSNALVHRWIESFVAEGREVLFPGFVAVALGLAGLWIARRTGHGVMYGVLGALAFWASFGPAAGLYTVFFKTIPVFSLLRAPARFGIIVALALAVLSAMAVARIPARWRWLRLALVAAAAIDLLQVPVAFRENPPYSPAYTRLASMPRGAVAVFPFYSERDNFPRHAQYMLFSTTHWQPLINGYSDYIPDDFRDAAPALDTFPSPEAFDALRRFRARYLVLHFNLYDHRAVPGIPAALERGEYAPYVRALARDDDVWVYQIIGWP